MITKVFLHKTLPIVAAEIDGGEGGIWAWDPTTGDCDEQFDLADGEWIQLSVINP